MKKIVVALFIALLLLAGCGTNKNSASNHTGSIKLDIKTKDLAPKTIEPDLDMEIATYDISGNGPEGTSFSQTVTSESITLNALGAGEWTITVDARNDEDIIIASGYTMVTVVEGAVVNATVTVTPPSGVGTLNVNLSWPSGVFANPSINATLTPKGGTTESISFTISGETATYHNANLQAGYYTLVVHLYDGSTFKWGCAEAVRILAGQTSTGEFPIIPQVTGSGFGNVNLTIIPNLQNPIDITFSGQQANLIINSNMTITATTSEPVDTYQWYLNGWVLTGETNPSITIGSTLLAGNYRLDLLVTKGCIVSSGYVEFSVNSPSPTPTPTVTATPTLTPTPTLSITPTSTITPTPIWLTQSPMPTGLAYLGIAKGSNQNIYVAVGLGDAKYFYEYNPSTNSWNALNNDFHFGYFCAAAAIGNEIYGIGGYGGSADPRTVEKYNPLTNTWNAVSQLHYGRIGMGAAVVDGKIYVIGGDSAGTIYNSVEMYDPANPGNGWTVKTNHMNTARWCFGTAVATDALGITKIYVIGGGLTDNSNNISNTVEAYNPATDTWQTIATTIPDGGRAFVGTAVYNNKIYVIGGDSQGPNTKNTVLVYDPVANSWSTASNISLARISLGAVELGGDIYAIGGSPFYQSGSMYNIVEKISL